MAQFHFVEDYQKHVRHLIATKPIDEAMSDAVGGGYHVVGEIEKDVLRWAGLKDGMTVLDLGCGSGRLAHALGKSFEIEFVGVDIVQELLDYARTKSPANYKFVLNHALTLPVPDSSVDMLTGFSLFTHLLHSESFLYLEEARRILKRGGFVVFSFLEFANPAHWPAFEGEVSGRRANDGPHLNTMIERPVIDLWSEKLGFVREHFVSGTDAPWGAYPLGQAVAVLRKP